MNCQTVQRQVEALIQSTDLDAQLDAAVQAHLHSCELCRHRYSDMLLTRELLALEVPELDSAFFARSVARAVEYEVPGSGRRVVGARYWSAAAAALLVFGLSLALVYLPGQQEAQLAPNELAQVSARKEVRVVIYSEEAYASAEFSIELAENLELEGYGGQQTLAWSGALNKGANLLTLPVLIKADGGELRVISRFGSGSHQVSVKVSESAITPLPGMRDEAGLGSHNSVAG